MYLQVECTTSETNWTLAEACRGLDAVCDCRPPDFETIGMPPRDPKQCDTRDMIRLPSSSFL